MASGISSGQKPTGVTDLDSSQTLSNKTLDSSSVVSGSTVTAASIQSPVRADVKKDTLANLQTYALTASNGQLCFATDAKKMYQVLDAALAEVGSGQGGINYISNPDFELNSDGWSSDSNLTIARSTSSPLRGDASGVISKAAVDASGEVVKIPFTIESADLAKKLYISFDKDASDANYDDADLRVEIIKDPNGTPVTIRCNAEDILGGKGTHLAWFQSDASILEYELVFKCNSANASAYSVKIDNVQVGPREVSYGSANTDSKPYTPTFSASFGTTSGVDFTYSRNGEYLEIIGRFAFGTTTAAEAQIGLPDNLKVSSKITSVQQVGTWVHSATAEAFEGAILATAGDNFLNVGKQGAGTGGGSILNANSLGSSRSMLLFAKVPIEGWSSNSIQSEDIGNREIRVRGAGNGGTSITGGVTPVDFTEVEDTTASWDGTTFTAPETGDYIVMGKTNITSTLTYYPRLWTNRGGAGYAEERAIGDTSINGAAKNFQTIVTLNKGDKFQIRLTSNSTLSNDTSFHYIHISKKAQPQTLLETETVAARYTSNSGQSVTDGSNIIYEDIDYDTHNAYNASTGVYTIPVTGKYLVMAKARISAADFVAITIEVNGTEVSRSVDLVTTSNSTVYIYEQLDLTKNDTIEIVNDTGSSRALTSTGTENTFSISRVK